MRKNITDFRSFINEMNSVEHAPHTDDLILSDSAYEDIKMYVNNIALVYLMDLIASYIDQLDAVQLDVDGINRTAAKKKLNFIWDKLQRLLDTDTTHEKIYNIIDTNSDFFAELSDALYDDRGQIARSIYNGYNELWSFIMHNNKSVSFNR